MNWIDYAVLGVIGLSTLFGLFRGLVRELIALIGWVAAFALAVMFASRLEGLFPAKWGAAGDYAAAFIAILIAVWLLAGVIGWLLSRLVKAVGLGWPDRILGGLFGMVRGFAMVLGAVMAAGLTPLPREPVWREAALTAPLETAVIALKPYMPPAMAKRLNYRAEESKSRYRA